MDFRNSNFPTSSHCGVTDLFKGCDINSSQVEQVDYSCAKMLNFSQPGGLASQEFGTQDFATPGGNKHVESGRLGSQLAVLPVLGAPPSFDGPAKRGRTIFDCSQSQDSVPPMEIHSFDSLQGQQGNGDLKGCKKVKALAPRNVGPIPDLCTCSTEEAEGLDVDSILRHHAIPAGSPGSFAHCYQESSLLGNGSFGSVIHARCHLSGQDFAVKMTAQGRDLKRADVIRVLQEGQLMRKLASGNRCDGTLEFYSMWIESMSLRNKTQYQIFVRMELCSCSLQTMRVEKYHFSEDELLSVIKSVASVLSRMHEMNFAHLDVKPANILRAANDPNSFKLADFGNAVRMDGCWDISEGDRIYLSQEMLEGDHSNPAASDIFSLGITVLELAMGCSLPDTGNDYLLLRRGQIPVLQDYSEVISDLIKKMMEVDPLKRPQARELATLRISSTPELSQFNALNGHQNQPRGLAQLSGGYGKVQSCSVVQKSRLSASGNKENRRRITDKIVKKGQQGAAMAPLFFK